MTPAEEIVRKLYESIMQGNAAAAAECYCGDARYRDLAFDLKGKTEIAAMWRFVCSNEVKVEYCDIRTEGDKVKGYWVFNYLYEHTNPVRNPTNSTFTFRDGKILVHHDHGNRFYWARQALGIPAAILVTIVPCILRILSRGKLNKFRESELDASKTQ